MGSSYINENSQMKYRYSEEHWGPDNFELPLYVHYMF